MIRTSCILVVLLILMFSSCSRKELNDLRTENQTLKSKIASLEQENNKLKETADYHFQQAVDAVKSEDYQKASEEFEIVIEKYPNSPLMNPAKQQLASVKIELDKISRVENGKKSIEDAISQKDYEKATIELNRIKKLISSDDYNDYNKRIYEEKHKPVETTINKLISDFGSMNRNWDPKIFKMIGMRIKFNCSFSSSVDRDRKSLTAYNGKHLEGSSIELFYEKSNMEEYFTQNDPNIENMYTVTGKLNIYSNSGQLYVSAEKIESD